jgi:hypothetical protein
MASVECLQAALRVLVAKRQALHEHHAGRDALEANRVQVGIRLRQLSQALIERYGRYRARPGQLQLRGGASVLATAVRSPT